jgi:hypothetical protein
VTLPALRDDALSSTSDGFELRLGLPWIRSLPLSSLGDVQVSIDGERVDPIAIAIGKRAVSPDAVSREPAWWFLQDRVVIRGSRILRGGSHHVAVSFRLLVPYLQAGPDGPLILPFRVERPLELDAAASAPTVSRDVA